MVAGKEGNFVAWQVANLQHNNLACHLWTNLLFTRAAPNLDCHYCILEEQFSNDCLKTVTKAITLINHNRCKQHDELIRTGSNVTCSKHKKSLVYKVWLVLVLLLIGWKNWCKMLKPITKHSISLKTSLSTTENRSVIWWVTIYPTESPIHHLNNWDWITDAK